MIKQYGFSGFLIKIYIVLFIFHYGGSELIAQSDEDCMMCHEDPELTTERNGQTVSMFVQAENLKRTVHGDVNCIECHDDVNTEEFFHADQSKKLKPVDCGKCHKPSAMQFSAGIHGQALKLNEPYAPDCKECHGTHDILSQWNSKSRTYKMNIPILCGNCHKEGSPVARIYNIDEHNIVENYSQGIHGKGLYQSGLLVTATCNNCHNSHLILPHESPNSSVNPKRIARTCMKCHIKIEQTHKKVIKSELWEQSPGSVPSCTDCHPPHKVEYQKIEDIIPNQSCLKCHNKDESKGEYLIAEDGDTLDFKLSHLANSEHYNIQCAKCHTGVSHNLNRPCETADKVDCSNCHIEISGQYFSSGHGMSYLDKHKEAPYCTDCHGTHETKSRFDDTSPTYRGNIPQLCGNCHIEEGQANTVTDLKERNAYYDYSTSIHGKGLTDKGLLVSAVCTDCHTTHHELKESDSLSSVHPLNVPTTCAKCHKSIYDAYNTSEHSIGTKNGDKDYPTCSTCHPAHFISEIDQDEFMTEITVQCGTCHEKLSKTYKDTYHGKAYMLGDLNAARCSDCHGAHNILRVDNPNSMVGQNYILNTCKKCHSDATNEFTGYLTHATHNDNPILFWSFWGMTTLLLVVFIFFGLHTIFWLPRSLKQRRINKHKIPVGPTKYYRRFNKRQRFTHMMVILSFVLLAFTGMILKFAHMEWAQWMANIIGGVKAAGNIHRFAAVITFGYFTFHLLTLIQLKAKAGVTLKEFFLGDNSLILSKHDWLDFIASLKWFFGKGPRPEYGRWTYWEKFDYIAVFWGVAVIGFSGLVLWFPEFFTTFLPGWAVNVAQIIHSDEALLAVGFIFTIHFFNTHLRPESFPMDTVIFTGYVPLEEYKKDRPREYKQLVKSGKLDKVVVEKDMSPSWIKSVKLFGYFFLALGIGMVFLIIYSLIVGVY